MPCEYFLLTRRQRRPCLLAIDDGLSLAGQHARLGSNTSRKMKAMAACRAAPPPRYHSPFLASVNGRCMALTVTVTLTVTLTLALKIALQFFIY